MIVRFLKNYRRYKKGTIFDQWSSGAAKILIKRHIMEEIVEETVPPQKKRGRPRKDDGDAVLQS